MVAQGNVDGGAEREEFKGTFWGDGMLYFVTGVMFKKVYYIYQSRFNCTFIVSIFYLNTKTLH